MKKILTGAVTLLSLASLANAGTLLVSPNHYADPEENEYPSSQFGVAPQHGQQDGFAADQVTDMEEGDDGSGVQHFHASRGIASVGDQPNSGIDPSIKTKNDEKVIVSQSSEMRTASEMVRKGVQEVAIIASDLGYFPKTVFVSRDVPVRMFVTGSSKNTLCIMMDSFQVRKQIRSQKIEEITFTPSAPGKYRFYCPVNGMEGQMVVKEFSSTPGNEAYNDGYDNNLRPRGPAGMENNGQGITRVNGRLVNPGQGPGNEGNYEGQGGGQSNNQSNYSGQRSSVGIASQWDTSIGGPQR
jgi:plastocyanin